MKSSDGALDINKIRLIGVNANGDVEKMKILNKLSQSREKSSSQRCSTIMLYLCY